MDDHSSWLVGRGSDGHQILYLSFQLNCIPVKLNVATQTNNDQYYFTLAFYTHD